MGEVNTDTKKNEKKNEKKERRAYEVEFKLKSERKCVLCLCVRICEMTPKGNAKG